jgi:hypothetical protein
MVEERRVSLLFLDEVDYFRKRAARWCEPPVQYRFVREDLVDAAKCRVGAALPLLAACRRTLEAAEALKAPGPELDFETTVKKHACLLARAIVSLRVLLSDESAYALDEATRVSVRAMLQHIAELCSAGTACAAASTSALAVADRSSFSSAALVAAMAEEGLKNAHRIGTFFEPIAASDGGISDDAPVCAVVHERGRPRWGPARGSVEETLADRKAMRAAMKAGKLDETLLRWRGKG